MNNNTESETTYDYIVKNIFNEINTLQTLAPIKSESYNTRCSHYLSKILRYKIMVQMLAPTTLEKLSRRC